MKRSSGFTLIELLVVISIIAILASLALPAITGAMVRGQMTQTLSNMKQLHLASQQMALDATTTGDTNLGWPGDTGGSWAGWATNMVSGNYMSTNDFAKMISAPGVIVSGQGLNVGTPAKSAVIVYKVGESSEGGTVFLSSANYDYNSGAPGQLAADARPYGNKGFIVYRKAGDGTIFQARQYNQTNLVGISTNKVSGQPGT